MNECVVFAGDDRWPEWSASSDGSAGTSTSEMPLPLPDGGSVGAVRASRVAKPNRHRPHIDQQQAHTEWKAREAARQSPATYAQRRRLVLLFLYFTHSTTTLPWSSHPSMNHAYSFFTSHYIILLGRRFRSILTSY